MAEARPGTGNVDHSAADERLPLTDEHRMLLDIRDALYEGRWEDFKRDLQARVQGDAHVFETVPASPEMCATIRNHLRLIEEMCAWEVRHGRILWGRVRAS